MQIPSSLNPSSSPLSDIAFIGISFSGHINFVLGFLQELKAQDIPFDFYGGKNIADKHFRGLATNIFEVEEFYREETKEERVFLTTCNIVLNGCVHGISKVEKIWEKNGHKPRLIIADFLATYAGILGKRHNIPVLVCQSVLYSYTDYVKTLNIPLPETFTKEIETIEAKYSYKLNTMNDMMLQGDRSVNNLPEFWGKALSSLEEGNRLYIGPGIRDEDASQHDFDMSIFQGKKIIYVSFGTTNFSTEGSEALDNIIEAFKDSNEIVLISAKYGKAEELIAKGLPKNIIVKTYVPQFEILKHTKLFFSHMGSGGVTEALAHGVPFIALPWGHDQIFNARTAETLKVGKWLKAMGPEDIRQAVEEVMDNEEISRNVRSYQTRINMKESRKRFCEIVKSMIE